MKRRYATRFATLVLVAGWLGVAEAAPGGTHTTTVSAVDVTVGDLRRSVEFYTKVLDFRQISMTEIAGAEYEHLEGVFGLRMRVATLRLGDERLILTQFLVPRGKPLPYDSRANDRWFQHVAIVVADMDRAYDRLRQFNVEYASTAPQTLPTWNRNAAGIRAFYFRDPDGHFLELIQFPRDKGDPKWRQANGRLFLGIDHTAIVVTDTTKAIAFYQKLGFQVVGASDNYGSEQEHLNNVFGAHLRVTSMRATSGPGVELLEYLAPRDGRPAPANLKPTDLAWWQVVLSGAFDCRVSNCGWNASAYAGSDRPARDVRPLPLPDNELGFRSAAIISDPDGHHLELTQP